MRAMAKTNKKAEFGDFQTPAPLAQQVCSLLAERGLRPASLLEPTCGHGSLLFAGLNQFALREAIGADINPTHIKWAKATLEQQPNRRSATLATADFFATDWQTVISKLPEPILVLGNPPWVTNSHLGSLGSQNLPTKSNFQGYNGIDAITGKANFDISEWMLIQLLDAMSGRTGTLAMLCKATVARKALCHAWKTGIGMAAASIYGIDAALHFEASVDAVLLVIDFVPGATAHQATVYSSLKSAVPRSAIGFDSDVLLADVGAYRQWKHLCGETSPKWRSGIKHDCAKVMELRREANRYRNGLGELIDLESDYLYPLLKSSDLANDRVEGRRWMIVPQKSVGEDTGQIKERAPRTWTYLSLHAALFGKRGSSIYRKRPAFSIFGVGDYSFAPWKVAISGLYKRFQFAVVGPIEGKVTMLDDTSYFLPCDSREQADYLASLLNSTIAASFFSAFVFWDAKRPITAELLGRLDLRLLARELGTEDTCLRHFGAARKRGRKRKTSTLALFPE